MRRFKPRMTSGQSEDAGRAALNKKIAFFKRLFPWLLRYRPVKTTSQSESDNRKLRKKILRFGRPVRSAPGKAASRKKDSAALRAVEKTYLLRPKITTDVAEMQSENIRLMQSRAKVLQDFGVKGGTAAQILQMHASADLFSIAARANSSGFCTKEVVGACISLIALKKREFEQGILPKEEERFLSYLISSLPRMQSSLSASDASVESLMNNVVREKEAQKVLSAGALFGGSERSQIVSLDPMVLNAIVFCLKKDSEVQLRKALGKKYQDFENAFGREAGFL